MIPPSEPELIEDYLEAGALGFAIPNISIKAIRLLTGQTNDNPSWPIVFGAMRLKEKVLSTNNQKIRITDRERVILKALMGRPSHFISRDELLKLWKYNPKAKTHTVETHIYRLREKLKGLSLTDVIVYGDRGYYLRLSI